MTMRRIFYILLIIVICCVGAWLNGGNFVSVSESGPAYHVAVLHSFDEKQYGYKEYNKAIKQSFKELGVNAKLHDFYLDLSSSYSIDYNNMATIADSLEKYNVDLIITEGTLACYKTVSYLNRKGKTDYPIVAGGVTVQVWDSLKTYPNLSVWVDEMDYPRLIEMATTFNQTNKALIELDNSFLDDAIREELAHSINRPPFFNNLDLKSYDAQGDKAPQYKDSIIVMAMSAHFPRSNQAGALEDTLIQLDLEDILSHCAESPSVIVKKDIYSNVFANATQKPQFTALPYDFGDENTRYLAGYFVPFKTQAKDVVTTAANILKGNKDAYLNQGRHIRQYVMDYNAMAAYPGLAYADYEETYTIINAPFKVAHPIQWMALRISMVLLIGLAMTVFIFVMYRWKNKHSRNLQEMLVDTNPGILGNDCLVFDYTTGKSLEFHTMQTPLAPSTQVHVFLNDHIAHMFHPNQTDRFNEFEQACTQEGYHTLDALLTFNQGQDYHWWRMRYVTQLTSGKKREPVFQVIGILNNVDNWYKKQDEMEQAQKKADEVKRRDDFMRTLNHEIRTPLNSVLGFTELLSTPNIDLAPEEKEEYCRIIKHNANRLNNLVTDILQFSRIESGRMKYEMQEIPVGNFMDMMVSDAKAYIESKWLIDDNGDDKTGLLKLDYQPGWGEYRIKADPTHLQEVYKHLISNAVKFSSSGTIHTGWYMELQSKNIFIYVEDNGMGIAPNQQKNIFRLFYKSNYMNRGIGLGLSISHELIEKMGGQLYVRSSEGKGSRFVILMPMI